MIALPPHVTTRWIATLGNQDLVAVEARLSWASHSRGGVVRRPR